MPPDQEALIPLDFAIYLYRKDMGISWDTINPDHTYDTWRVDTDLWYMRLRNEAYSVYLPPVQQPTPPQRGRVRR